MSTSTTPVDATQAQDASRLWRRPNPTTPIVTRDRSQSAPPVMKSTPPAATPTPEEELLQLLAELRIDAEAAAGQATPVPQASRDPALNCRDASDDQLDDAIDALFKAQLATTITEQDDALMQKALNSLLQMLPHNSIETRKHALPQLIPLLKRMDGGSDAIRMAIAMLDEFIAVHVKTDEEQTNVDAGQFIEAMHAAIAAYSPSARNRLLVYELWGAKKLGNFTMAKLSVDLMAGNIGDDDQERAALQIEQAVDYIQTMPLKYRLMVAIALYQRVPADAACKLRALEAIANHNIELPDTIEALDFSKIVNQQIYELRMADAASN